MPNIQFNYLYCDSANYKNYGSSIFANPDHVNLSATEKEIRSKLIYDTYFYADQWQLPELFSSYFDYKIDPTWHEFENVEQTDAPPTSTRTLSEFLAIVDLTKS
jgi:hypothetical protein